MIKRSLVGLAAASAAMTLLVPVGAANAGTAKQDMVSGKGASMIAAFEFKGFNQGTTPDSPSGGTWEAKNPALNFKGPITCLHVEGNRAGFIYPVEEGSTPEAAVGQSVLIWIEDNGASGDKMGFFGPGPVEMFMDGCAPGPTPLDITSGGVTVVDAP
ncbi:MAG: hypothetical protein ACT4P1_14080 [Sporichthyaceae bacterium]